MFRNTIETDVMAVVFVKNNMEYTINSALSPQITPGQHEWLRNQLQDQVYLGRIKRIEPKSLPWDISQAEYGKLKALYFNNKFTELETMLFELGAKGTL